MNPNWPRWSFVSFSKHFTEATSGLNWYVEGTDRQTMQLKDFAEFRMDGPRIVKLNGLYRLDVVVNVLIQSTQDDHDGHRLLKTVGKVVAACAESVSGYKFGDGPDDNRETKFACFGLLSEVRVNNFGTPDKDLRKQQATIEARYRAELES